MAEYFYISLFAVVALVVIGALLALSTLLGPRNPTPQKLLPYECGIVPTEEAKGRYPVRFATIAMLFIIFDVEVVFMYPWAVALGELGLFGLVEMAIFIVVLGAVRGRVRSGGEFFSDLESDDTGAKRGRLGG